MILQHAIILFPDFPSSILYAKSLAGLIENFTRYQFKCYTHFFENIADWKRSSVGAERFEIGQEGHYSTPTGCLLLPLPKLDNESNVSFNFNICPPTWSVVADNGIHSQNTYEYSVHGIRIFSFSSKLTQQFSTDHRKFFRFPIHVPKI